MYDIHQALTKALESAAARSQGKDCPDESALWYKFRNAIGALGKMQDAASSDDSDGGFYALSEEEER